MQLIRSTYEVECIIQVFEEKELMRGEDRWQKNHWSSDNIKLHYVQCFH
ncbi:hypothetical protein JNK13_02785 [bacterium]|nr:hypothetical protein [bacterium]